MTTDLLRGNRCWNKRFFNLCISVLLSLLVGVGTAHAHGAMQQPKAPAGKDAIAEGLTQQLIAAQTSNRQGNLLLASGDLKTIAKARQEHFAKIIQSNPGEVLRLALSQEMRSKFAEDIKPYIEEQVSADGDFELLHFDMQNSADDYYTSALKTSKGRLSLHFAQEDKNLKPGGNIRVSGVKIGNAIAVKSSSNGVNLLAEEPSRLGEQKILVMAVNFVDNPVQPWTKSQLENLFFAEPSEFYREISYGQTWVGGTVTNWLTINTPNNEACGPDGSNSYLLADRAKEAANAAGYNVSGYQRLAFVVPEVSNCKFWGLGTLGGSPSMMWLKQPLLSRVVSHELGHNMGLWHSQSWDCGAEILGNNCVEFGDPYDSMGMSTAYHFNAIQKDRLGFFNSGSGPAITTITSGNSQHTIETVETPKGSLPKALKIERKSPSLTKPEWFYVELRKPIGFDGRVSENANIMDGVLVHKTSVSSEQPYLLDMAPHAGHDYEDIKDPALRIGQQFQDPLTGITIKLNSMSGNTANLSVGFSGGGTTQFEIIANAGANGSINPTGKVMVNQGSDQTFNITPSAGYVVADVMVDGGSVGARSSYTFPKVQASHSINATFKPVPTPPSITGQPQNASVTAGQTANFSVKATGTAPLKYQWRKNGTVISGATSASYTTPVTSTSDDGAKFSVVVNNNVGSKTSSEGVLTVKPSPVTTFTITATAGPNGSITPSGKVSVDKGSSKTFTITPNAKYEVAAVMVNGVNKGAISSVTVSNVQGDQAISATFKLIGQPNDSDNGEDGGAGGLGGGWLAGLVFAVIAVTRTFRTRRYVTSHLVIHRNHSNGHRVRHLASS